MNFYVKNCKVNPFICYLKKIQDELKGRNENL